MYHAHFGLKKALFEPGIAQEAGVYLGPRQQAAIAGAKTALKPLDSAMLMTGAAGVGKTTLASAAVRAASTRLALGWLTAAPAHASELLELLLVEFGLSSQRATRVERLQMWRQFLNEMSATETRVFVLVERCEDHSVDALRALDALTAADPNGGLGANLVLLGGRDLGLHLKVAALDALRQRIRLRQRVEPLDAAEVQGYLAHHAALAGGSVDALLEPAVGAALLQFSGGLPRVVNNLLETALDLAAAEARPRVDAALIRRVAIELFGLEPERTADDHADAPRSISNVVRMAPTAEPPAATRASAVPDVGVPTTAAAPPVVRHAPAIVVAAAAAAVAADEPQPPAPAPQEPEPAPPPEAAAAEAPPASPTPLNVGERPGIVVAADDSFATTTIVDEPEVPMEEFPVLTDAVDDAVRDVAPERSAAVLAAAPRAAAADLDIVRAALAVSAWIDEPAHDAPPAADAAPAEVLDDPFDWFDLGSDAPLELIDDTHAPAPHRPLDQANARRR
jgi:type II secretory pathway predicted ATPase ExeA